MQSMNSESLSSFSNGPLNSLELQRLTRAIQGLSANKLSWVSGYLAGMAASDVQPESLNDRSQLTILYASQSGNARSVAASLGTAASTHGLPHRVLSVSDYRPRDLVKEHLLILVTSTQGEGEPPESALELYRFLHGKRAPRLEGISYTVFGLGDSSYEHFCQAARDFDLRLEELGARRIQERVEADVNFSPEVKAWMPGILDVVGELLPVREAEVVPLIRGLVSAPVDRDHPYTAEVVDNRRITTRDALSEVHHLALGIDPQILSYQPGDALGVWFRNDPELVEEILSLTGLSAATEVEFNGETLPLVEALTHRVELTQLHPSVVMAWAKYIAEDGLLALAENRDRLRRYARERQFIDLITEYPADLDAAALVALLLPLQPRLYSIASSQAEFEDEVHLTVSALRYQAHDREHLGGASGFLTQRLADGDQLEVYVAENSGFRLPAEGGVPILMIGAGTGVAPYRAFLQQRAFEGASGRNWLISGNRQFHRDFLYQTDWLSWRKSGLLQRLSPVFSRDGADNGYVQHRIREDGAEVYRWLMDGAQVYVCGGTAMEVGVRQALVDVARAHGGLSEDAAGDLIEGLRAKGRYQRDVY